MKCTTLGQCLRVGGLAGVAVVFAAGSLYKIVGGAPWWEPLVLGGFAIVVLEQIPLSRRQVIGRWMRLAKLATTSLSTFMSIVQAIPKAMRSSAKTRKPQSPASPRPTHPTKLGVLPLEREMTA